MEKLDPLVRLRTMLRDGRALPTKEQIIHEESIVLGTGNDDIEWDLNMLTRFVAKNRVHHNLRTVLFYLVMNVSPKWRGKDTRRGGNISGADGGGGEGEGGRAEAGGCEEEEGGARHERGAVAGGGRGGRRRRREDRGRHETRSEG